MWWHIHTNESRAENLGPPSPRNCRFLFFPSGVRVRLDGGPHVGASVDSLLAGFPVAVVFFARPFRGQGGRERGGDVHCGHVCVWVGAALFADRMRTKKTRLLFGPFFLAFSGGRSLV